MNEIALTNQQLPENIEDLSRFALIGREKLKAVRAEISAIQKVGLAEEVLEQKRSEAQEIAELVTMAEVRIGKMLRELPKATTNHKGKNLENRSGANFLKPENSQADAEILGEPSTLEAELSSDGEAPEPEAKIHAAEKPKTEALQEIGITKDAASRYQKMADNEDIVREAMNEARAKDDIVTRSAILNKIRQKEKAEKIRKAEQDIAGQASGDRKPVLFVGDGAAHRQPKSYDLLLTDPPYSTDVPDIQAFVDGWLYNALDNVKPTGSAYIFVGAYQAETIAYLTAKIPDHMQFVQRLVWTYKNTLGQNPKDRYKLNYQDILFYRGVDAPPLDCPLTSEQWAVQEVNAPDGRQGDRYHAWQKPMELAERFIRHSTRPGMSIFDPFACTGTFLLAAAKLGRIATGFEISEKNAAIAFERGCVRG